MEKTRGGNSLAIFGQEFPSLNKLIDEADETWVVSPAEQALLQRDRPEKSIQVVSNIVDVPGSALPFEERKDLLFIGSFQHPPNVDAVGLGK